MGELYAHKMEIIGRVHNLIGEVETEVKNLFSHAHDVLNSFHPDRKPRCPDCGSDIKSFEHELQAEEHIRKQMVGKYAHCDTCGWNRQWTKIREK